MLWLKTKNVSYSPCTEECMNKVFKVIFFKDDKTLLKKRWGVLHLFMRLFINSPPCMFLFQVACVNEVIDLGCTDGQVIQITKSTLQTSNVLCLFDCCPDFRRCRDNVLPDVLRDIQCHCDHHSACQYRAVEGKCNKHNADSQTVHFKCVPDVHESKFVRASFPVQCLHSVLQNSIIVYPR